jgi:hypothetical protein
LPWIGVFQGARSGIPGRVINEIALLDLGEYMIAQEQGVCAGLTGGAFDADIPDADQGVDGLLQRPDGYTHVVREFFLREGNDSRVNGEAEQPQIDGQRITFESFVRMSEVPIVLFFNPQKKL